MALLNGHKLQLRGASIHEDDPREGGALSPRTRANLVHRLEQLHATVARAHYPLHPALLEAFDRAGIMYWSQAPVYQLPNTLFNNRGVRGAAQRAVNLTVRGNANHASIFVWSLVNEPAGNVDEFGKFGPGLKTFIRQGSRTVRRLDDTRWVAIDHQSRLGEPVTQSSYRYLDVLGVNEYLGWYNSVRAGLPHPDSTTPDLSGYLDSIHRANRKLPLFITEYGAEGSRHGPKGQKGSYEFQSQLHARAPQDPLVQALHQRLDRLGAEGLPRGSHLARRRAARLGHAALAQQEPDRAVGAAQAGVLRGQVALVPYAAVPPLRRSGRPLRSPGCE